MHNSSLVAIAQYFWRIRTSVLYGNQKKFNTEAVNDYPPIRFEIRFERKFPIVGLYFLTLPVETLWNLEKLFGMRMAGLCQFYWRTCYYYYYLHSYKMYEHTNKAAKRVLTHFRYTFEPVRTPENERFAIVYNSTQIICNNFVVLCLGLPVSTGIAPRQRSYGTVVYYYIPPLLLGY